MATYYAWIGTLPESVQREEHGGFGVKNMARTFSVLMIVAVLLLTAAAQDQKAQFTATRASSNGLDIEVSWKERGLWPESVIHNVITSEATATYVCLEGAPARMADHQNVDELLTVEGDFNATKQGSASGRLTLKPPSPGMFSCSPGQQLKLACVVYTRLTCRDDSSVISLLLRGKYVGRYVLFQPGYSEFCDLDLR